MAMKIDDLKTEHESDRIAIVLGIISIYIALFSAKDELPFDATIVLDTSGPVLTYLAGYLVMTAFCYRYDETYTKSLKLNMDAFRKLYYDVGAMLLPLTFCSIVVFSFSENPWVRTIGILAPVLFFIIRSYGEFRHKMRDKK